MRRAHQSELFPPTVAAELPQFIAIALTSKHTLVWSRLPRERGWSTLCPFCGARLTAFATMRRPMYKRCPVCEEWVPQP